MKRLDVAKAAPGVYHAMLGLEKYVHASELDPKIRELVKMRASQINGCAYCLDMHSKDARAQGETEQRLYLLNAWREAPFYSDAERAALAWAEALTRIADEPETESLLAELRRHFSDKEIADLSLAIVAINGWNRLAIALGADVGSYQPQAALANK
jgi:AhpD family alkylhydroperoxidase